MVEAALVMGRLSLKRLNVEGLEGGLVYWVPWVKKRKALGMGISLHGGSVGQPRVGSSTRYFERWLKGALEMGHLCESSVKGTWMESSLAGHPGG
jgi:hypothetical protein